MSALIARSHARTTRWNLIFQYCAVAFALISGIILVPLYLRHIPIELYGAWLATGNIALWITTIDPGLSTVLQQRVAAAYGSGESERVGALVWSGITINLALSLLILAAGLLVSGYLHLLLNAALGAHMVQLRLAFEWSMYAAAATVFSYALTAASLGLQGSLGLGIIYTFFNGVAIVTTVVLLTRGYGLISIPLGSLVRGGGLVMGNAAYLAWRLYAERLGGFALGEIRSLLRLISYTFSAQAGATIAGNMDAFLVTRFLGPELTTVFSLTRRAPEFSRWIVERPTVAMMPALSHMHGAANAGAARATIARMFQRLTWLLGCIFGGFLALNADFVRLWVGDQFYAGAPVSVLICMGVVATVLHVGLCNAAIAVGAIRRTSTLRVVHSVLLVALSLAGVHFFGMIGLAAAPIVAGAVSVALLPAVLREAHALDRMTLHALLREAAASGVVAVVVAAVLASVAAQNWPSFVAMTLFFVVLYSLGLAGLSRSFRAQLRAVRPLRTSASVTA